MDTSDPNLTFDANGVCSSCRAYDDVIGRNTYSADIGWPKLRAIADRIKQEGRGKRYDCVIGLSGGVDSTYVAYLAKKELGLRPLAIHLDNGWNTETAVRNIENIVKILDIDLQTFVIDWEEFRDLQKAFLLSSTPDCEIPSDHAIVSSCYHAAVNNGVRFVIGGSNYQTEQMIPHSWSYGHSDWKYIRSINAQFGGRRLKTFPHDTRFHRRWWYPHVKRLELINILNYIDYNKRDAIELMKKELGWVSYGDKHHESIYTRFYQTYILPKKFGADKRRPHLSCLIKNGEITRDQALATLQRPPLDEDRLEQDRQFVIKKLGFSEAEFGALMDAPPKSFWDYPSYEKSPPFYDHLGHAAVVATGYARRASSLALSAMRRLPRMPGRLWRAIVARESNGKR